MKNKSNAMKRPPMKKRAILKIRYSFLFGIFILTQKSAFVKRNAVFFALTYVVLYSTM